MTDTDHDLDEHLARALRDAVPPPPRELVPEALRTASPDRPRRRALGPALVAAAIVVIAVGVGLVRHHENAPNAGRPPGPTGYAPAAGSVADPAGITTRVVARLLQAAPTLPGAVSVDHPPVPALGSPSPEPGSGNVIQQTRWFTAPGTMAAAIAYFTAHPPAGMKRDGSSTAGGPEGTTSRTVSFGGGREWLRPTVYEELELLVTVAPVAPIDGDGIRIRVDATAVWLPQRTAAEEIPGDVTSVDIVVDRNGGAPTVRRTLGAAQARALAGVVNRLPVSSPGVFFCSIMRGWTDVLTFHASSGEIKVEAVADGCQSVTVGPRSEHNPALRGGAVDLAVLNALGLPPNYGS